MNKISLFIGRFQPLHKGHLSVIKDLSGRFELVKIGIGSSQEKSTDNNPLSAGDRKGIIEAVLSDEGIFNYEIYFIPDIPDDNRWVSHVRDIVGGFDVVSSGNALVIRLFKEKGFDVEIIREMAPYKSTLIRKMISEGREIKELVPGSVYDRLINIGFLR